MTAWWLIPFVDKRAGGRWDPSSTRAIPERFRHTSIALMVRRQALYKCPVYLLTLRIWTEQKLGSVNVVMYQCRRRTLQWAAVDVDGTATSVAYYSHGATESLRSARRDDRHRTSSHAAGWPTVNPADRVSLNAWNCYHVILKQYNSKQYVKQETKRYKVNAQHL